MSRVVRHPTILHLITGLGGGGAEALLRTFVSHSRGRAFRHVVVSMTDEGVIGPLIKADDIPVHVLGMRRGQPSVGAATRLWQILDEEKPSVLQSWMYHAILLGTVLALPRRLPHLCCLHAADLDTDTYGPLFRWARRGCAALSPLATGVVANSRVTYDDHRRLGYRNRRWAIIGNGFDTTQFVPDPKARIEVRAELGLSPEAPLVGLMARFDPMKDHATFLAGAGLLAKRRSDVHFLLAGIDVTASNAALCKLIERHGLEGRAHLLGFRKDAPRLLAALDVATSTSVFGESFSNTTAEAMACGVPCVVTRVAALPLLVEGTGVVVPPSDPLALSDALFALLDESAAQRQERGAQARARIVREFTIEQMITRYEALYQECISSRNASSSVI